MAKLITASEGIQTVSVGIPWRGTACIKIMRQRAFKKYMPDDIEAIEEVDHETYRSAGSAAGWAIAGGLLGGAGLLAGAALGGRKRGAGIYVIRFSDGDYVVFEETGSLEIRALKALIAAKLVALAKPASRPVVRTGAVEGWKAKTGGYSLPRGR